MKNLLVCVALLAFTAYTGVDQVSGQGFQTGKTSSSQKTNQFVPQSNNQFKPVQRKTVGQEPNFPARPGFQKQGVTAQNVAASPAAKKQQSPWKISSRIHLEKGKNQGYLVVQIDLADGYHVYSLNAQGSPSPTKLAVLPSNDLKVTSKFVSAKAPIVIEKDPVFGQRIEKHKGQVQFFAQIQVRPGIDPKVLSQEVQFSGQVCSDSACQPIRNQTSNAAFAGYFEIPAENKTAATGKQQLK